MRFAARKRSPIGRPEHSRAPSSSTLGQQLESAYGHNALAIQGRFCYTCAAGVEVRCCCTRS